MQKAKFMRDTEMPFIITVNVQKKSLRHMLKQHKLAFYKLFCIHFKGIYILKERHNSQ